MATPRKPKQVKLSFEPIERMFRDKELSDEELAAHIGITRKTMNGYRNVGMAFFIADQISCRLGYHPTHFWGDKYFAAIYDDGSEDLLGLLA